VGPGGGMVVFVYAGFISGFRSRGGKHIEANFKGGGANTNPRAGVQSHIKYYRESQFPRGGGRQHPLAPLK
jgi:hypothetical protein